MSNREVHSQLLSGLRPGTAELCVGYLAREAQQQARKQQAAKRGVKHEIDSHGSEYSEFRALAQQRQGAGGGSGRVRCCRRHSQCR